jgi:hypothetical protein
VPRKSRIYLDANVLIPSVTRGLLIIGAVTSDYLVCWSEYGEAEAQRHQHERAAKLSDLRRRFGWNVLVPEADLLGMEDTDPKDQPHLAAAHAAGARLIVTENIKDFGVADLARLSMAVVVPDLFLSLRLEERSYVEVLSTLAEGRDREPRTPAGIHGREVSPRLPRVAGAFATAFDVPLEPPVNGPMAETFRGFRCVRCEETLVRSGHPLCDSCRSAVGDSTAVL